MASQAAQACRPCRRPKRKCTRELPSCALCLRLGKPCGYSLKDKDVPEIDSLLQKIQQLEHQITQHARSSATDGLPMRQFTITPTEIDRPLSQSYLGLECLDTQNSVGHDFFLGSPPRNNSSSVLSALFLSTESFNPLLPSFFEPKGQIPRHFLAVLQNVEELSDLYFLTIHKWLPMINKRRLIERLSEVQLDYDGTAALLLICMKLVTTTPYRNMAFELPLYQLAKQFYSFMENAGSISISLLQASILIAVYEFSQGLYPAAFLSIGQAARHGTMMGLHSREKAMQMFKEPDTWTYHEEERRTWWAVLLVDRYLHSGTCGFPIITCDPAKGTLLPCDDKSWDLGLVGLNEPLVASTFSESFRRGQFTTLCRATHIIGRVIRHKYDDFLKFPDNMTEAVQFNRAILSLELTFQDQTTAHEIRDFDLSRALCHSARMILYKMYARNEQYGETDIQKVSMEGLSTVSLSVARMAARVQEDVMTNVGAVSPLICHCLYQAARDCASFVREKTMSEMKLAMEAIVDTLRMLRDRWRICDDYLRLLEAEEGIVVAG